MNVSFAVSECMVVLHSARVASRQYQPINWSREQEVGYSTSSVSAAANVVNHYYPVPSESSLINKTKLIVGLKSSALSGF